MMKKLLLMALFVGTFTLSYGQFITVWKTDNTAGTTAPVSSTDQIKLPVVGTYKVDWVKLDAPDLGATGTDVDHTDNIITFSKGAGKYQVTIYDVSSGFYFQMGGNSTAVDCQKLIEIKQWGDFTMNRNNIFRGCTYLQVTATNSPMLSGNISGMFMDCKELTGNIYFNNWVLDNVTSISSMFRNCSSFNADISNWNTEKVTDMSNMFNGASVFNQSLTASSNKWNVATVTSMNSMFRDATEFNQPLNSWNTASLIDITNMFRGSNQRTKFNQPLNNWNTTKVTTMNSTFRDCDFDQNIGNWSLKGLTGASPILDIFRAANNAGISCANFTKTIQGWSSNNDTPPGLNLGMLAPTLKHGDLIAYGNLTGSGTGQKGWTITPAVSYDATCAGTLPVNFLSINATLNGSNLLVQWQTASEQNNDYFSIYASEDGKNWEELGRVNSKVVNGNSNTVLSYEYSTVYSSTTVQLAGISILGVLALAFLAFNRRNRWLISATAVICFGMFSSSCQKNELLGEQDSTTVYSKQNNKAIYIKVMQTDKDGKTSESGIVTAKRK